MSPSSSAPVCDVPWGMGEPMSNVLMYYGTSQTVTPLERDIGNFQLNFSRQGAYR
jgi:hypothetical protein